MDEKLYKEFDHLDGEGFWWFSARRDIVVSLLERFLPKEKRGITLLDVGCGTGYNLLLLKKFGESFGLESSVHALSVLRERGFGEHIIEGHLPNLVLPQSYNIITTLDVIEHVSDDQASLQTLYKYLLPGGTLLVTVPAYQWLWSRHDEINHHVRRYTKKELTQKIKEAGFTVSYSSYYNTFLFIPVIFFRLVKKIIKSDTYSDFNHRFGLLEYIFGKIFLAERFFLGNVSFPFGLSLVCVAKKTY